MANEQYSFGNIPLMGAGYGIRTTHGILLPPGGKVAAYVRSGGQQEGDDAAIIDKLVTTLASGLARCRASLGDTVVVLPGHSESVTDATMLDNLKAGTRIIGVGEGSLMPTFRWTATGSQWVIDDANVTFDGLLLRLEGANGVVKAIVTTAAATMFRNCEFEVASGATAKATIALEVGSGANKCRIIGNRFYGTSTHNVTDGVKVVAAVTDFTLAFNHMHFSATAGNGCVHLTAAALRNLFLKNYLFNDHTASTACIAIDAVAATGMAIDNRYATINDGTANAQGLVQGAGSLIRSFESYSCDEPVKSGVLEPAAVAT